MKTDAKDRRPTRIEQLDAFIRENAARCSLDSWNAFTSEIQVPSDLALALQTNRPELLKIASPRDMTKDEVAILYNLIGELMRTNMALREHAQEVAKSVKLWSDHFKPMARTGHQIERFANFEPLLDPDEDDGRNG